MNVGDKPCIAHRSHILHRHLHLTFLASTEDEPTGVEHVDDWEEGVGVDHREVINWIRSLTLHHRYGVHRSLTQRLIHFRHLGCDMRLNEFLIATQFGCMIATHRTVECTGVVVVEGGDGEVQHTIVAPFPTLLDDVSVGICLLDAGNSLRLHKHVVVKITLVHAPHVHQTDDKQSHAQQAHLHGVQFTFLLFLRIPPHSSHTQQDEQDAAPSIGTHHSCTHVGDAAQDVLSEGGIEITCSDILIDGILVAGAQTIMSKTW